MFFFKLLLLKSSNRTHWGITKIKILINNPQIKRAHSGYQDRGYEYPTHKFPALNVQLLVENKPIRKFNKGIDNVPVQVKTVIFTMIATFIQKYSFLYCDLHTEIFISDKQNKKNKTI